MKKLPLTQFGNPILRAVALDIDLARLGDTEFQTFIDRSIFTMHEEDGVGLASPQVGDSIRLFIANLSSIDGSENRRDVAMINPKITSMSKETYEDWEGCLSFPDGRGLVSRAKEITVTYIDRKGEKQKEKLQGLDARVVQHEIDHLDGILYIDRMDSMKTLMTVSEWERQELSRIENNSRL